MEHSTDPGAEAGRQAFAATSGDRARDNVGDARAGSYCKENGGDEESQERHSSSDLDYPKADISVLSGWLAWCREFQADNARNYQGDANQPAGIGGLSEKHNA
jgi:hypothetical protein